MVKLHLIGFTTDLKNLIFATRRGAKRGGYMVGLDKRLLKTLEEIERLENEGPDVAETEAQPVKTTPPEPTRRSSILNPKQIQALLREGKSEEQVAKLAQTDVSWISRFTWPIVAERAGVIEVVRSATISKQRLGPSALPVGDAVQKNLAAKRVLVSPEAFENSWKAVRKGGRWQVSFQYVSRGQRRVARFSFDPESRQVSPLNQVALDLGWAPDGAKKARRRPSNGAEPKRKAKSATNQAGPKKSKTASKQKGRARSGASG